ncbi:MAG: 16S rRNA (guanine(966)-N(2))-methyltransferase RsmD [Ardenticatenales bacterium]
MRVIAGSAKGRRLAMVPGDATRPITDRAKEALFSIVAAELPGARVLDVFAGTGGVGIEALSRGAAWCDFIDLDLGAIRTIRANLAATGLADRARVLRRDAFDFLGDAPTSGYDVVFIAPPQYRGLWSRAMKALDARPEWVASGGLVIVQIHPREALPLPFRHFEAGDVRSYGSVQLHFWERTAPPDVDDPAAEPSSEADS